jgi:hypothetical protein
MLYATQTLTRSEYLRATERPPVIRPIRHKTDETGKIVATQPDAEL